ncbi:MAG: hypothetical protein OEY79_01755 [Anaplasmataceae bacterium]|nr:hypothetical protein [Anaplasmataceae bacterium]
MQINQLNHDIYKIEKHITNEKATIQILEAEWSYLTRPSRLSMLAKKYLKTYKIPNKINDSSFLMLLNK